MFEVCLALGFARLTSLKTLSELSMRATGVNATILFVCEGGDVACAALSSFLYALETDGPCC